MSGNFTESTVEQAAVAWLASTGWSVKKGSDIEVLAGSPSDYVAG
jgi:hypothetical protein